MFGIIMTVYAILIIVFVAWTMWLFKNGKYAHMKKYTQVDVGMSENEMLEIMGRKHYNVSSYSDGRKKYEWVIDNGALGGVRKVEISVEYGSVTEIIPYNV